MGSRRDLCPFVTNKKHHLREMQMVQWGKVSPINEGFLTLFFYLEVTKRCCLL